MLLWLLPVLLSGLVIICSPRGLLDFRRLQREYRDLTQKNYLLERENQELYRQILHLRNDLGAIEHLARQELGLAREGELIFQFLPPGLHKDRPAGKPQASGP